MATIVKAASADDEASVLGVITLAFSSDPMARWSLPDPDGYLKNFPLFVKAFGEKALGNGTAYFVEEYAGAALWLGPGVKPDEEALISTVEQTAPVERKNDLYSIFEQMDNHHPTEPHWYLPMIGVDPTHQGNGVGSALMKHALMECDKDKLPAYLESSNPRNVSLYERHGFEVVGEIQAGSSPIVRPMFRKPRR